LRSFVKLLILMLLVTSGWLFWNWDSSAPTVTWTNPPPSLGKATKFRIDLADEGRGIEAFKIQAVQSGQSHLLLEQQADGTGFFSFGSRQRTLELSLEPLVEAGSLSEGEVILEVEMSDRGRIGLWSRRVSDRHSFTLDLTPPRIEVMSRQHYLRHGGSQAVLYRVSESSPASGVLVSNRVFVGYPAPWKGNDVHVCLFALAHDEEAQAPMFVWAEDQGGNRARTALQVELLPRRFRKRKINLSDGFFQAVLPEILDRVPDVEEGATPLETFLEVNDKLRRINHLQIEEIARKSTARPLWDRTFAQLSNSKVESVFADERSYYYDGNEVDNQTHLGFDLASVARTPIECSNDGVVAYADYLGIYGNCVIVDHGLGLLSLYAHLSSIQVEPGDRLSRGQSVGLSGQTGLAGGDHLHFSMIVQGVHVNPLEWWDPKWIEQHVLSKIQAEPNE